MLPLLALVVAAGAAPRPKGEAAGSDGKASLPRLRPLVGQPSRAFVEFEETLLDVAWRHRVGFEAVQRLNPDLDPWVPPAGSLVDLPTELILPDVEEKGLVINIPEMRLYDFRERGMPGIYAVAVGDAEDPTPVGSFKVGDKRVDPTWNVPASIRAEKPHLPASVPPGPDNPLGSRWMTIGNTSYGVHGTNVKWSIGRIATHGCVRLYEDEMERLYDRTSPGTPLRLAYEPFKWGLDGRVLYLEAHPDLYGRTPDRLAAALAVPRALDLLRQVDLEAVFRAVYEARGVPVPVGEVPEDFEPPAASPVAGSARQAARGAVRSEP
jgi:L,D-transpeptidase ErfK/SrfK